MAEFVHLHVHSEYSLRESTLRIAKLIERAKEHNSPAVAVTDRNAMYGLVKFYRAAKSAGIKPILGVQLSVCFDENVDEAALGRPNGPLVDAVVLLAETLQGYRNLVKLVTCAATRSRNPVLSFSELQQHQKDVIALIGGGESVPAQKLSQHDTETAHKWLIAWLQSWPKTHLFVDLQDHGVAAERQALGALIRFANDNGLPVVATNDCHYLEPSDADVQRTLADLDNSVWSHSLAGSRYDFPHPSEMERRLGQVPGAIENTVAIANRCNVELPIGETHQPKYPTVTGEAADVVLQKAAQVGVKQRYGQITKEIRQRLEYELSVISRMGFADYFLVVADFIRYAHKHGISTGPGRGSAAGSLVAYGLRITDVDPVGNNLLFERFLNPERITWPDIDTDFEYERRGEVIDYVLSRYGASHVAQIGTFGTLAARAAIRDVGRSLRTAPKLVDKLAKLIPSAPGMTLDRAHVEVKEIPALLDNQVELQRVWGYAKALEGLPRHTSVHAAGVVISPFALDELVPVQAGAEGIPVTQYPMEDVEVLGLIKMDFLGLRTLTLIDSALTSIRRRTGVTVDWRRVSQADKATLDMLGRGETEGCFQLESAGMRRVLRELKPSGMEDLIAVNALYRPGPMDNIPTFIKAKRGRIPVTYPHRDLEPILKDTYGVIVYQEQIMQIAAVMAGFSLGQADILRRAVGKKKREVLDEQRAAFVGGCQAKGYEEGVANEVYDLIVRFADYGFNRCHAAAYAVLSYRTAWLRANYLPDFLAALLSLTVGNADKEKEYTRDANRHQIAVLPPNIQTSLALYTVESDTVIRAGLLAVRNVGNSAVDAIIDARKTGEFKSLVDFLGRINPRTCNKKAVESLLKVGALNDFLPADATEDAKIAMLEEAYYEVEEGRQSAGLGLQFDTHSRPRRANDGIVSSRRAQQGNPSAIDSAAHNRPSGEDSTVNALYIRYPSQSAQSTATNASGVTKDAMWTQIKHILTEATGDARVLLYDRQRRKTRLLPPALSVTLSPELIAELEEIVGLGNVKVGRLAPPASGDPEKTS